MAKEGSAEDTIRAIKRETRRKYAAEEKSRNNSMLWFVLVLSSIRLTQKKQ